MRIGSSELRECVIHPSAQVAPDAQLGADVEIGPYVVVQSRACIGDRTKLMASVCVEAGCVIGPDCEVHAGTVLGGPPQVRGRRTSAGRLRIGPRNVIREHVTINRAAEADVETVLGADNLLMAGCHVGHGCRVGNGVTIASGALLAGHVTVADGAFVSGNVAVHQHVNIGRLSMIGGLSRVSKDVLPFVLVVGNSRVCGLNVVGMRRANMTDGQRQNVRRAYRTLYRSGLNVTQAVARLREMPPNPEIDAWLSFIQESKRGLCAARRSGTSADRGHNE